MKDTIVAVATPPGRGGVAVVRVSGTKEIIQKISVSILRKTLSPRYATFSSFFDNEENIIDQGIVIYFPGPHSFTGEDVLEFQGHGGPIVVDCLIQRIVSHGARLAKPGEFSERAFLNGKMDLTQAEAISDLIDASSVQAARSALRSLQGEFSEKIRDLVDDIVRLRMYVEAAIDFVEEEIDFLNDKQIFIDLERILKKLKIIQSLTQQGTILREGITVVIVGEPNVGKSSLLNQLSGRDVAIVTNIPGTTRDILRDFIVIDGIPIHIIDTAGLRESVDVVEQEGIKRAKIEMKNADFILHVTESNLTLSEDKENIFEYENVIKIRNKIDITNESPKKTVENNKIIIYLSAKTGEGIELLKNHIKSIIGYQTNEGIFSARQRHIDALNRAETFLLSSEQQLSYFKAMELMAEDLRQAQQALNEITGEFTSDDLLGKIFSNFCIGK